ncbi:MAG: T9SS type A sorting domain-containing protein, partial [Bacteroidetes bacterium]|nr:T9SS type A sorting domain-containing protein [Bacteroidota bacterium]
EEGPVFGCPTGMVNSCPDIPCDHIDQLSNYMNFADDICMDHFTRGQADRMHFFLNSSLSGLVDGSNANASACSNAIPPVKLPEPEFTVSSEILCPGDAVTFLDITSGCNDSVFWEFEGGIPARDSTSNPTVVYLEKGLYKVKLTIVNKLGKGVRSYDHFIHVASDSLVDSLDEGFEGGIFEPENWLKKGSAGPSSWVRNTFTSSLGEASVVLPNFTTASCGTNEDLITPPIGLAFAKSAVLFFDYAYQQRSMNSASFDRLLILVSEDCGLSFKDTIFDRSGPTLATIPGIGPNQIFLPDSGSNQWKTRNISLDKYVGNKAVRLMFRGIGQKGQHLYLDNIIITTTVSATENIDNEGDIKVFPNPFHDSFQIEIHAKEASYFYIGLMDMHGRKLLDTKQNMTETGNHLIHFDQTLLNRLTPGLYLLEVQTKFGRFVRKIVKL